METKYIIGLLIGLLIYIGAVSGIYLVYKPNIDYLRERRKKLREARKKALEMAEEAKKFQKENTEKEPSSEKPDQH
ncbi:MAG TPA: hypothetical protein DHM90_03805 [Clostridiaceae bacterium]|nr:hypothetical protein [Clostridiaceae bacterium]